MVINKHIKMVKIPILLDYVPFMRHFIDIMIVLTLLPCNILLVF